MTTHLAGPLYILVSALFFSVTGTLQALAPSGATPWVVAEVRMLGSAVVLFLWCLAAGRLPRLTKNLPWKAILVCSFCTCCYQIFFFYGALKLGVAVGTVVCVGATPVMSAVIARIFFGQKPRPVWYLATLIAVAGIALLNVKSFQAGSLGWVIFPLLGAFVYGIYMNESPQVSAGMEPEAGIMISLFIISIALLPALFVFPADWIWGSARGLGVCAAFALAGGIGFGLFFMGMKTTTPVVSATLSLAEPMGAACWGIFLLGEDCSLPTLAGIALILASIVLLIRDGAKAQKQASS
ncbi:DMT family transporter [Mesosutterella sp. OilRF-GAM-744-9]|uniref:DMT family transporter n=1 Tax=Mesosutterella porci TaxID=2915351 RepID=A0ABS9MSK9_9BURK|nr:DMT family transporter [Mesosutterella sp. oilRF-744-WT-GAM-9]MCG5030983.1 DMT family transporter [Mesosutterella sp. oilRF-744-WT-GAM-9]MCI6529704.1 DMT family transporter [Mesosutterella sp.]